MKAFTSIIVLLFLSNTIFAQSNNSESSSVFEVSINAKKYIITDDEEISIDGKLDNPKISIRLLDLKKFNSEIMSFDYPNNFSFEVEKSEGYKNWAFDGNDFVIMIFDIDGATKVEDFVENMIIEFGEENCETEDVQIELGGKKLSGMKILVNLIGQSLTIDFLEINSTPNNASYLMFQDILNEDGSPSLESIKTLELIDKTVIFK
jgi:hypothetical protein